ncbi:hypothetical protein COO60DRAFT_971323 [Scenedesmus sp. NREL 46B-D3]|nr:hypothetical protein COO60DRAFT_971323 [Scenedesmus sp. NREL 46B-D3]
MAQKPAVALMLCLSAVGLAAQASASPASINAHLARLLTQSAGGSAPAQRQLLQQSLETARPQCVWKDGKCDALDDNWLMYTGVPTSPYMRAILVAQTRDKHCKTHKNKAACWMDTSNRCFWMELDGRQVCNGIDRIELLLEPELQPKHCCHALVHVMPWVQGCRVLLVLCLLQPSRQLRLPQPVLFSQ